MSYLMQIGCLSLSSVSSVCSPNQLFVAGQIVYIILPILAFFALFPFFPILAFLPFLA